MIILARWGLVGVILITLTRPLDAFVVPTKPPLFPTSPPCPLRHPTALYSASTAKPNPSTSSPSGSTTSTTPPSGSTTTATRSPHRLNSRIKTSSKHASHARLSALLDKQLHQLTIDPTPELYHETLQCCHKLGDIKTAQRLLKEVESGQHGE